MNNRLKFDFLHSIGDIEQHRINIQRNELLQFWQSRSLLQMQQILTIKQSKLVEHIWQYFSYYLTNKKSSFRDAYCLRQANNEAPLMYFYDCKIFKSTLFSREINEMMSSFIMRYLQKPTLQFYQQEINTNTIYQFLNPTLLSQHNMIVKCKSSCLLKIYSLFQELKLQPPQGDVVVLPQDFYFKFIYSWTQFTENWEVEPMVKHLFVGIMILMQNQIMLQFVKNMSQKQKQIRKYQKPVAIYFKPKLKSTSTMMDERLGDVQWNTLKINAFKVKYKVVQDQNKYVCYRVKQRNMSQCIHYHQNIMKQIQQLTQQQDIRIYEAFNKLRIYESFVFH